MDEIFERAVVATAMATAFAYHLGVNEMTFKCFKDDALEIVDGIIAREFASVPQDTERLYAEMRDAVIKYATYANRD